MKEILVSRYCNFIHLLAAFRSSKVRGGYWLALGSGEFQGLEKVKRCPASSLPGPSVRYCKEMDNW